MAKVKRKIVKKRNSKQKKEQKKRLASERFKSKSRFYCGTDITSPFDAVISEITAEELGEGKDRGEKDIVWLEDHEKGVVLNQTMGLQLGEDLGDVMAEWPGQTIHVFTERARNPRTGKVGPAVRVRGADVEGEEDELDDDLDGDNELVDEDDVDLD